MIIVLIIQVLLFGLAIFQTNTIQNLSEEYLDILEDRVLFRKDYVEDEMLRYWSNLRDFEVYIQKEAKKLGLEDDLNAIPELLETVADQTVFALRQSGVTEIFIMLEGEKAHEGIYLRDLDPSFNAADNSDVLMERGSVDIARKTGVPLDSQWASKFKLLEDDEASEFYYKPFQAAESYPNMELQDLGYWSRPFRLSPDDIEIITYSLPLLDDAGNPYGVIGVGLTVDYLCGKLKYDELIKNKQGAYLLSVKDTDIDSFEKVASSGPMYNSLIETQATLYEEKENKNMYKIRGDFKRDGEVYASTQDLSLYNANSPFEKDSWSLTGFVEKKALFAPIEKTTKAIIISLLISFLFGIISAYIVGIWFMKPINKLMGKVSESNPSEPFKSIKTNILEIDELGYAIETLNNEVLDSASKVSRIINMVDVSMGAFEYTLAEDIAFCTNTVFDILGIENENTANYVAPVYLKEILDKIMKGQEKDSPNIYHYEKNDGTTCYVRMITQEEKDKVLGVIEDVTDEVLLKHKMEYERDHDVLTHLYNRRSFEVLVKEKMQEKALEKAAFIMWDLDNLKYINDTYGHEYGDRYIQEAASVLNGFTKYNAIVARMSGDEFYTFVYGYKEKEEIRKIINEIKENLYNTFLKMPNGESIRIRASGGIAWYPDDSRRYEELIEYSDFAMYEVKNEDKGDVLEFSKETYNKDSILLHGREELNHFIEQKLLKYAFQPIIDVRTAEIFAYEALMRPQTKKIKLPFDIIRLARSQSKLYEIEKLTLFEVMTAFEKKKEYFKGSKVFINSIPNHMLSNEDLEIFEKRFANYLDRIVITITEKEQNDKECTNIKQGVIERWGGELALDGFGSGYNSELALSILSPKYMKIGKTIVRGIDIDQNRQKFLKRRLSYANNRGIKIIAEGVETRAEMDKLIEFGVNYMQGYYLGKPHLQPQRLSSNIELEIKSSYNSY